MILCMCSRQWRNFGWNFKSGVVLLLVQERNHESSAAQCPSVLEWPFSTVMISRGVCISHRPGRHGRGVLRWRGRGHRQRARGPGEQLGAPGERCSGAHQHLGAAHRPLCPVLHPDLGQVLHSCEGKVHNQTENGSIWRKKDAK